MVPSPFPAQGKLNPKLSERADIENKRQLFPVKQNPAPPNTVGVMGGLLFRRRGGWGRKGNLQVILLGCFDLEKDVVPKVCKV